jgi:hypothetical protein
MINERPPRPISLPISMPLGTFRKRRAGDNRSLFCFADRSPSPAPAKRRRGDASGLVAVSSMRARILRRAEGLDAFCRPSMPRGGLRYADASIIRPAGFD